MEATFRFYRRVKVFETVATALRSALASKGIPIPSSSPQVEAESHLNDQAYQSLREQARTITIEPPPTTLDRVDLSRRLTREEYEEKLNPLQERLRELLLECYRQRVGAMVVYEGWDAAGKGETSSG